MGIHILSFVIEFRPNIRQLKIQIRFFFPIPEACYLKELFPFSSLHLLLIFSFKRESH